MGGRYRPSSCPGIVGSDGTPACSTKPRSRQQCDADDDQRHEDRGLDRRQGPHRAPPLMYRFAKIKSGMRDCKYPRRSASRGPPGTPPLSVVPWMPWRHRSRLPTVGSVASVDALPLWQVTARRQRRASRARDRRPIADGITSSRHVSTIDQRQACHPSPRKDDTVLFHVIAASAGTARHPLCVGQAPCHSLTSHIWDAINDERPHASLINDA